MDIRREVVPLAIRRAVDIHRAEDTAITLLNTSIMDHLEVVVTGIHRAVDPSGIRRAVEVTDMELDKE